MGAGTLVDGEGEEEGGRGRFQRRRRRPSGSQSRSRSRPFVASPCPSWTSPALLTLFRENATIIADNYLKSKNIKLRPGRKSKALKYDSKAYNVGKEVAKKINLKRKRVEGKGKGKGKAGGGFVLKEGARRKKRVKVEEEDQEGGSEEESEEDEGEEVDWYGDT